MFNAVIKAYFEQLTLNPPDNESVWYAPWNMLLNELFPSAQGYAVRPQVRIRDSSKYLIPDFSLEVVRISTSPLTTRVVLIVEIKNSQHWPGKKEEIFEQLSTQGDLAFEGTARDRVYCIAAIGSHWTYGVKFDNGQDVEQIHNWNNTVHDFASYQKFCNVKELIDMI